MKRLPQMLVLVPTSSAAQLINLRNIVYTAHLVRCMRGPRILRPGNSRVYCCIAYSNIIPHKIVTSINLSGSGWVPRDRGRSTGAGGRGPFDKPFDQLRTGVRAGFRAALRAGVAGKGDWRSLHAEF